MIKATKNNSFSLSVSLVNEDNSMETGATVNYEIRLASNDSLIYSGTLTESVNEAGLYYKNITISTVDDYRAYITSSSFPSVTEDIQITIEENDFENAAVWIDSVNGSSGVGYPLGTKLNPVDNYTDAKAIADVYGIKAFMVKSAITISAGQSVAGLTFTANGNHAGMTFNGSSTLYTVIKGHMHVQGTLNGHVHFHNAHFIASTTGLEGFFENCLFEATNFTLGGSDLVRFINCSSVGSPGSNVVIDVNGSSATLGIWGYTGSIEIENKTGAGTFDIELLSGKITINSSCDNGTINVRGMGELEDDSAAGCNVVKGGLLTQQIEDQLQEWLDMIEIIQKIETGRWKIENNQMIFYDDDGTTPLYTFDLKDASGDPTEQNVFERIIA